MGAQAAKLMNPAVSSNGGMVFYDDMTSESRAIGKDDGITQDAVVRNVGIGHEEVGVAYNGSSSSQLGPPMDGHELPELVVISDLERRLFSFEFEVLRLETD
jgi:hypothetical protein